MKPGKITANYPRLRIANFTEITVPDHTAISVNQQSAAAAVALIRKYADLPYVFLFTTDQINHVSEILSQLKAIRSPCYPYGLIILGEATSVSDFQDLDVRFYDPEKIDSLSSEIAALAQTALLFDKTRLSIVNQSTMPKKVDVLIVGGGITGLFAADQLRKKNLSFCIAEKEEKVGGIWSKYANITSQVNTSEGAYRLLEHDTRINRDHSYTAEMLKDIDQLASGMINQIYTGAQVDRITKTDDGYRSSIIRNGETVAITSRGVLLAINDRVGAPRTVSWQDEDQFQGTMVAGHSDETAGIDWKGKRVVVVGMGAFAVENVRTALEAGASYVTVVCRRHGTVCPKIIDYLNFSTPYDESFEHDKKSNIRNMMLWKKLYDVSGASEPECWMGKIKHTGHTISVSDIWFVAHYLKKMETVTGNVSAMYKGGVIVDNQKRIEADVVVKCVGFHRNASSVTTICDYAEMYNNNYIDKDFMYLADAYIDDNAFNSFFGSSVLEMTKFYLDVYLSFFGTQFFDEMVATEGIEKIDIKKRSWSHYINGAMALIKAYPRFSESARTQVEKRTADFVETHDLETYIKANKREWIDAHSMLAGKTMTEQDCLPYVFERLAAKKIT